jgi:hypothetical protein
LFPLLQDIGGIRIQLCPTRVRGTVAISIVSRFQRRFQTFAQPIDYAWWDAMSCRLECHNEFFLHLEDAT